jgi:tRNA(Ile)-lysidine synthase
LTNSSSFPRVGRLERLFDETVAGHRLITPGEAVLAAVSGGPDSLALVHLLAARAAAWQLRLGIAHVDHGLRAESAHEAEVVARLAAKLAMRLHTERVDVRDLRRQWGLSLEAAGRQARYRFFEKTAEHHGYDKVALGHHADDNAETLLLNLLRGSGRLGLGGMAPMRAKRFIRPLIRATRADIEDYLNRHRLCALVDPMNADNCFLRNRIRHQLIPLLERDFQPRVRAVLHRSAEILREEEEWIEGLIEPLLQQVALSRRPGCLAMEAGALRRLAPAAQRRVVRAGLHRVRKDLGRITFDHVEGILNLAQRPGGGGPLYLPHHLKVWCQGDILRIGEADKGPETFRADYSYRMERCGRVTVVETGDSVALTEVERDEVPEPHAANPFAVFLDAAAVEFPVTVRNFRPGDRFAPLGAAGTQKLKKFFIDHKVLREQRRRCPLLISRGDILWVAGYRIAHHVRLSRPTRKVLKAELILADSQGNV